MDCDEVDFVNDRCSNQYVTEYLDVMRCDGTLGHFIPSSSTEICLSASGTECFVETRFSKKRFVASTSGSDEGAGENVSSPPEPQ